MSGCGGDAGPGDVAGGELVKGVERRGEFGWAVGPVGCHHRPEDVAHLRGSGVGNTLIGVMSGDSRETIMTINDPQTVANERS